MKRLLWLILLALTFTACTVPRAMPIVPTAIAPTRSVTPPVSTALPTRTPLTLSPTATAAPTASPTHTLAPPSPTATAAPTATSAPVPTSTATTTAGWFARQHLAALSQTIGARVTGTPGEAEAARYVQSAFEQLGYDTSRQPFSFDGADTTLDSANIIAVKRGQSSREIIVGAHYDSVDVGRGADDNASGVAVMLEVARRLQGQPTPYTIRFIVFGGEEEEMQGSSYYVHQMSAAAIQNTVVMINLDSLIAGDLAYVYGDVGAGGAIREWSLAQAQKKGLLLQTQSGANPAYPAGTTGDWSDHAPFRRAGIPYAYLESTNWNLGEQDGDTQVDERFGDRGRIWHTPHDTIQYIDQTFPGRIDQRLGLFVTILYDVLTQLSLD